MDVPAESASWLLWAMLQKVNMDPFFEVLILVLLDCWIMVLFLVVLFYNFLGTPVLFSVAAAPFIFSPTVHKCSIFSPSLSTFVIFCFFDNSLPYEVIPHSGFNLHFPDSSYILSPPYLWFCLKESMKIFSLNGFFMERVQTFSLLLSLNG